MNQVLVCRLIIVSQVFETLRKKVHEEGLTILSVEQNARMAFAVADYAYVLEHGRIAYRGDCLKLRDDPEELYPSYTSEEWATELTRDNSRLRSGKTLVYLTGSSASRFVEVNVARYLTR